MSVYDKQDRGGADDYAAYFAGMNKSMQQKVALTTAHFPPQGTVADMGSGSGQATFDLASLYPGLRLVGVDVNPKAVEHAASTYVRDNLSYKVGDIADKLFADEALDGILDSSVLHHVTSFNDYSLARLHTLLDNQVAQLAPGGVLIIRDFVIPDGPEEVLLQLDADDAPWFLRFVRDFRCSQGRVQVQEVGDRRFRLTLRSATEFVLRKDYRDHWETELQEEYTYFTQRDFEQALTARNLRVVVSVKLWNPWIVQHRFAGKFTLTDLSGKPLPYPPTNYLIVGEKRPGRLVETHRREAKPSFLLLQQYRRGDKVFDLVQRPHATVDVLPWFEAHDRLYVLAKHGFPRPLTQADTGSPDLLGLCGAGYVTEPLAAIGASVEEVLTQRAGLSGPFVYERVARYFTSPGGISERVDAFIVRIPPQHAERAIENYSSFTTSGSVRFLDATQVLRASHVGGMFDARLELNTALLLRRQRRAFGPWIGAEIAPAMTDALTIPTLHAELPPLPDRRVYEPVEPMTRGQPVFLQTRTGTFAERVGERTVATARFEYVVPRGLSCNTVTALPLLQAAGTLFVGIETRDLPAVQQLEGSSAMHTLPAMRLPRDVAELQVAEDYTLRRLTTDYGLTIRRLVALGGRYYASVGVTPEVVYPYVAEVAADEGGRLVWVNLQTCDVSALVDAHLMISLLRCMHACDMVETKRFIG